MKLLNPPADEDSEEESDEEEEEMVDLAAVSAHSREMDFDEDEKAADS